jgi:hypothetical protein
MTDTKAQFYLPGEDPDDDLSLSTASSQDCTGLIPAIAMSDEEVESYTDIYRIPGQGSAKDNSLKPGDTHSGFDKRDKSRP